MIFIVCKCGWLGIGNNEHDIRDMHKLCDVVMWRRFTQSRMAADGMAQILSEVKWRKS